MKRFNASLVVVFATLGAAPTWAKVSAHQGEELSWLAPAAQSGGTKLPAGRSIRPADYYVPPTATPKLANAGTAAVATDNPAHDSERANMGMMILVGLGMVGTLMVKSSRP